MRLFALAIVAIAASALAQQPALQASKELHGQLPPSTIYQEVMHPLDVTREDVGNWSDVELIALTTAMNTAHAECERLDPAPRLGEELYVYARLCSLDRD